MRRSFCASWGDRPLKMSKEKTTMSSIGRIHPELLPKDVSGDSVSREKLEEIMQQDDMVVPIDKKERDARKKREFWEQDRWKQEHKSQLDEYGKMIEKYYCGLDIEPRWCVWGSHWNGNVGVLGWIRPGEEDEFAARKLAKIISELGGDARAEKTEWNESLKGGPVYKDSAALNL